MDNDLTIKICYTDPNEGIITKWKIREGGRINVNNIICEYKNPTLNKFKSRYAGLVKQILIKENEQVKLGDTLVVLEKCSHTTVWRNICADCGTEIDGENITSNQKFVAMEHCVPDLLVSEENALELGKKDKHRLLQIKKLALLVDLDQTMIHTTNDNIPQNLKDVYHFELQHGKAKWWYHTKLRPHTENFLKNISEYYELHICTFGVRPYAHAIAHFLDPDKKYFQYRILSRDECFHPNLKTLNLKNLFPCGDSMVCIMDDREDVWKSAPNMIRVTPYSFFDGTADINAPPLAAKTGQVKEKERRKQTILRIPVEKPTPSAKPEAKTVKEEESKKSEDENKEKDGDQTSEVADKDFVEVIEWEDTDDYLLHLESILKKIHASFYNEYDANNYTPDTCKLDLKDLVPSKKKKVPTGCNILFSGVIPLNQRPETNWAYRLAVMFGANVQKEMIVEGSNLTTHVIGMRDGTEKIKKAYKHKVFVVNIDWLLHCVERWEHVDERLYPISKEPTQQRRFYCPNVEQSTEATEVCGKDFEFDEKWMTTTLAACKDGLNDCEFEDSSDDDDDEAPDSKKRAREDSSSEDDAEGSKDNRPMKRTCLDIEEEEDQDNSFDDESDREDVDSDEGGDYCLPDYYEDND